MSFCSSSINLFPGFKIFKPPNISTFSVTFGNPVSVKKSPCVFLCIPHG